MDDQRLDPLVEVRESRIGQGVFVLDDFEPGECLGKVEGEVSTDSEAITQYSAEYTGDSVIEIAPPFRYLNHSCNPNCQLEQDDDVGGLVVVVLRPMRVGEEATIDYGWLAEDAIPCFCGEPNCRGWVVSEEEAAKITIPPAVCACCGQGIVYERLEFLVEARKELTCVKCSEEAPKLVLLDMEEKSGYAVLIPEDSGPVKKSRSRARRVVESEVLE